MNYKDVESLPPHRIQLNLQSSVSNEKTKSKRRIIARTRHNTTLKKWLHLVIVLLGKLQKIICCLKIWSPPIFNIMKKAFLKNENNSNNEEKSSSSLKQGTPPKKMVKVVTILMLVKKAIGILIDRSPFRNTKKLSNQDFIFIGDKTYHQKEIKNKQSSSTSKKNRIIKYLFPRKWRFSRKTILQFRKIESLIIIKLIIKLKAF